MTKGNPKSQIPNPKSPSHAALWLSAALAFVACPAVAQGPKGGKGPPPAPKVFVEIVRQETVSEPRTFVGTVKPLRKSLVGSAAPGRIEEYLINEGDLVKQGQPIAYLRRGIIAAEKKAAEAQLKVSQAELMELETSFQDEIEQARAKLKLAEAVELYRKAKRDRSLSLGTSVSKEQRDEDVALAVQAEAAVQEAQATLRLLEKGPREQKNEQARAKVEVQSAEVERLTEQFDRHTMFAPFDGYVSAEHAEIGQWVMQGDPVAEIIELGQVDIEIAVLEDYIGKFDISTPATVEIPALKPRRFEGTVAIVNPQADPRARTFPVKVRVSNEPTAGGGPLIKSGMFARVTMAVGEPVSAAMVPKDAVVLGEAQPFVFVVEKNQEGKMVTRKVPVTPGMSQGLWIGVSGELKPGDQVVVEGNERLRPMQEVRPERVEVKY